uniref:HMA domain-containing protein n=1 Tax=Populus trichocarpa TaxID=3694 RepID=B9H3M1_POPTR|eukprot:XP_002305266.2 heavy metal-associated isoprenylated plant protein 39 isoform X2 [Populus trichocarpa]
MQKAMLKLDMHDEKTKKKAMKTVSGFSGVDSISMDWNDKKLTVTGDIDPVNIVKKLRKFCHVEIVSVGEAKEPEKKKEEPEKQEDEKKDVHQNVDEMARAYRAYYPHATMYYHVSSVEDGTNACVIS